MSAKNNYSQPTGGFQSATHALYVKEDSFPKGCFPIGTQEEILAVYEQLLDQHLEGVSTAAAMKRITTAFEQEVRLYELKQQPNLTAVKQDPISAAIKVVEPVKLANKGLDRLSEMDPEELVKNSAKKAFGLLETVWGAKSGNPFAVARSGKYVNDARKRATDFFNAASEMRKDIMTRVNGLDDSVDGIAVNGVRFVKGEWLMEPANAEPLPDLSALSGFGQNNDQSGPSRKPGNSGP